MVGILSGSDENAVKSSRESGNRRSDILMKTRDGFEKAFVIELKVVKQEEIQGTLQGRSLELLREAEGK